MNNMTKNEKISWLQQHAQESYIKARGEAENELDELTPIFCFCGALATGFHTSHCRKFQEKLKSNIIGKLKDLLPPNKSSI